MEQLSADTIKNLNNLASSTGVTADDVFGIVDQTTLDYLSALGYTAEDVANHFNGLAASEDRVGDAATAYSKKLESLSDVISALKDSYDLFETAQEEMDNGSGLSVGTIEKLAKAEENYLDYLYEENGVVKLNTQAWEQNASVKMLGEIDKIQEEIDSLNQRNGALRETLKIYEDQRILGDPNGEYAQKIREIISEMEKNSEVVGENQDLLRLYTAIYQQIAGDGNTTFASLTESLSKITEQYDLLAKAQEEFASSGVLTASTLSSIVSKYPEMQQSVDLYIAGLQTERELLDELSVAYGVDLKNYQNAILRKMETSAEFYNSLGEDQKKLIDELGESYGIDLKNFQTIEQKKLQFQAEIIKQLAANYSKYSNASLDGMKAQYDMMFISGGDAKELKALEDAINAIDRYNYALKNIVAGVDVSSWTPKKFSSKSSSSADKKDIEEYTAAIDKHREAVERLREAQEKADKLETAIDNAGSFEKKIELQEKLIVAYREEQAALHNLNDMRDSTITQGVESLRELGFAVQYNADTNELWIENLEHLNELTADSTGKYDSLQEATNALRKGTEDLIDTVTDLNDENRGGSESLRELNQSIIETTISMYESMMQARKNAIALAENGMDNAISTNDLANVKKFSAAIIAEYQGMQKTLHEEAEYYRSLGYSDTSDEVSKLSDLWWDYANNIKSVKEQVVDYLIDIVNTAHDSVDEIQNVYDTLHDAADEFAANDGFISIDIFQKIIALGPQYMQYLRDENGLLVVNEESIRAVIAAKTEQLALDNAMTYVERLRLATQQDSIEDLNELLYATTQTTNATWDLVYANLALLDLDDQQYQAAIHNINAMRSMADAAISGIGKTANAVNGFESILEYVMDMLKQQTNDQIDALKDMKDAYGEIIDREKSLLEAKKKTQSYEKNKANQLRAIAQLQARIDALGLDNSREAQAERAKLMEELAEKQEALNELQSDKAVEAQKEALDGMKDSYDQEKDAEIKKLEDSISSQQKLYEMAISYIRSCWETNWEALHDELFQWNYDVGNNLQSEIQTAWDNCTRYITAHPLGIDAALSGLGAYSEDDSVWSSADGGLGSQNIVAQNEKYEDEAQIYRLVSLMKQNSAQWASSDDDTRIELQEQNQEYARQIGDLLGAPLYIGQDGVWYLSDGRKLYDVYAGKFHNGGVVGDGDIKGNERLALLKDKEWVLRNR